MPEIDPIARSLEAALDQIDQERERERRSRGRAGRRSATTPAARRSARACDRLGRLMRGPASPGGRPALAVEGALEQAARRRRWRTKIATRPQRGAQERSSPPLWSVLKARIGMRQSEGDQRRDFGESLRAAARSKRIGAPRRSPSRPERRSWQERVIGVAPQTFSTSGRPRMPDGMKISTMARIENAATSLYSMEK